jgi:eukaryotic-like serine/threonine-protein kinase
LRTAREVGDRVQRYLDGDRDLAERRRLASEHLARAQTALDAPDDQREAMREAGRALALDPTLAGAAELVGRLMIEPPRTPPPEVEQSLKADRERLQQQQSRRGMFSYVAYFAIVPFLFVNHAYLISYVVVVAGLMAIAYYGQTHPIAITGWPVRPILVTLGNGFVLFIFSRLFSPFLIGPGLACVIITTLMGHSAYRNRKIAFVLLASFVGSVLGAWGLEAAGVIEQTFSTGPSWMLIAPPVIKPAAVALVTFLVIYSAVIISGQLGLTLSRAKAEDDAQRQLHLQAWRLQQLVPKTA